SEGGRFLSADGGGREVGGSRSLPRPVLARKAYERVGTAPLPPAFGRRLPTPPYPRPLAGGYRRPLPPAFGRRLPTPPSPALRPAVPSPFAPLRGTKGA